MKKFMLGTAVVSLLLVASAAQAKVWYFGFKSAAGDVAHGTFVTGPTGSPYTVTDVTGTIDGSAITGISSYAAADQQLTVTGAPNFDVPGVSFSDAAGVDFNLTDYPDGTDRITNSNVDPGGVGSPEPSLLSDLTISGVPEPATWAMMLLGAGLVGGGLRLSRRKTGALATA